MQQFVYVIQDPLGIHARPAGLLARTAGGFPDTDITIARGGVAVRATQLMKLMGMGIRQGDEVTVTAEGASEQEAAEAMHRFFSKNL